MFTSYTFQLPKVFWLFDARIQIYCENKKYLHIEDRYPIIDNSK